MLEVKIDQENKIVILEPHGELNKSDFDDAVKIIDPLYLKMMKR